MNLEAIAIRRADEQLARGAWKRADRGEALVVVLPACEVCGDEYVPQARGKKSPVDLCPECRRNGWRSNRCPTCSRPTKTWDIGKPDCKRCRSERLNDREIL